jgi:hypothetical protein
LKRQPAAGQWWSWQEALHERIDPRIGILMTFLGEVEIHHDGFEAGMPEGELDEAEGDTRFEQRGGVRMSEGMDSQAGFGNPGAPRVDVGTLQGESCVAPEAQAVDRSEGDLIVQGGLI